MKTATGLALVAVGAILTFAVNAAIPGVNLQIAGLIVMLTGVAGLFVPARASGWLRRRIVLRGPHGPVVEEVSDDPYPADVMRDPATLAARILQDAQTRRGRSADAAVPRAGRPLRRARRGRCRGASSRLRRRDSRDRAG